ncbi:hypothetical protein CAEBREN_23302 [Caenorhabditis brenneri]|uniref:Decapping nuclease n=1 Tax=Caenorhabditis brenneri TaxID=135651 RepID=G0MRJ4_CAEBE|nr:hypothetical protein CAEBREN_23302 [Caenorhabditis brenneri]
MTVVVDIKRVGTYYKNADRTATPGGLPNFLNEDKRLYGVLRFEMDLKKGCENFKDEGYGDVFVSFFDYIKKTNKQGTPLKEAINADFISNRRILMIFAESPYFHNRSTTIKAVRKNGVIFLREQKTEGAELNPYGCGFKFEQNMTLNSNKEPFDENEPVSNADCSKSVMRTTLTKEEEKIRVFYTAEMDAIDQQGNYVEINTTKAPYHLWLKFQSLHHYLQSYLGSVAYIVRGQIDEDKIVKRVDRTWTHTIPKKVEEAIQQDPRWKGKKWNTNDCMEKLFEVLQNIKNELRYDDDAIMIHVRGNDIDYEEADNRNVVDDPRFLEYFE